MLLEKIENFTKYVRLKVHQEPPLHQHATPQFGQKTLGNPKHLLGWNSPRMMPPPRPTRQHADGASTNAQTPQHLGMRKLTL